MVHCCEGRVNRGVVRDLKAECMIMNQAEQGRLKEIICIRKAIGLHFPFWAVSGAEHL